ncbi:MAG: TIR domain-containing protein [Solirubrobacteraceae bacterium]
MDSLGLFDQPDDAAGRLQPVAAVMALSDTATGLHVLLKERTPLSDADDFGRLSLLGSRIQEADVAEAYGRSVSDAAVDPKRALDELWKAAPKRDQLYVPPSAFMLAVRRELFVTCGLAIDPERLSYCGLYVIDRDLPQSQVGFAIFILDLIREPFDELTFALNRAPHALQCVPVGDLADGSLPLNSFLTRAGEWLLKNALADRPPSSAILDAMGERVFIGHGGSGLWRELKDFVSDDLGLPWDEFNRVPVAGVTTTDRLAQMLDNAGIAFVLLTAEDETVDGRDLARQNVVHEAGLFQGRLGFKRSIVLLEDGCDEFSNIRGLTQIRFPAGNIKASFHDVRKVLEREGFLT